MTPALTALILTYNEEANICRTLDALAWVAQIVVIDSGSSDATLSLLQHYPQVCVLQRPFDSFAAQTNFGLAQIQTPWVLSLDADHRVSAALAGEIQAAIASAPPDLIGLAIPFRYCIGGQPLRGSLLPPRISLYRPEAGRYVDDGHAHRVQLRGRIGRLRHPLLHDDRKPLSRWLQAQSRYLPQEASKLLNSPSNQLSTPDRIRKHTPLAPLLVPLLCLIRHGGLLDGWRGWFYAGQRLYAELLLALLLVEARRLARQDC